MPFAYYKRLSKADRKVYRQSDATSEVPLPRPRELRPIAKRIEAALLDEDRLALRRASAELCRAVTRQLGVRSVTVKVLSRRPATRDGELHGLYTLDEDGRGCIEVWMRTAAHRRVVAYKTYLRTLLHELCHHLDFVWLELCETFHTEGFFRRESSLYRQLAGRAARSVAVGERQPLARERQLGRSPPAEPRRASGSPKPRAAPARSEHRQLTLF